LQGLLKTLITTQAEVLVIIINLITTWLFAIFSSNNKWLLTNRGVFHLFQHHGGG
jgi:hypothetical protein